jgi:D-alanine-D-alanine ligase
MMTALRVVVLAGGLSHERDVSLRSGRRVAEALTSVGVETSLRDVDAGLMGDLQRDEPDCVIPLLHGETGEDGSLREILELVGVPYVGSKPAAARMAFDKPIAKQVVAAAGVRSPASFALPADTFREMGAADVMASLIARLGLPLVVKPGRGGSALGVSVVRRAEELPAAMVSCFAYGPVALVERCVSGVEVAVAVLEEGSRPRALPAVEIRPDGGVYDYTARYTAGSTEFFVPARLDPGVAADCAGVAEQAHHALGLRDLSRSDLIVDADGTVWFLEVNVAPGMTETSLVPLSVEAAGLDLGSALAGLARAAAVRPPTSQDTTGDAIARLTS